MQRLTLILSDLYVPEEGVGGDVPQAQELPAMSALLRFAKRETIGDWRRWLLLQAGGPLADLPLAAICADERVPGTALDAAWLATPVALEARLDHARMADRGLLRLNAAERATGCEEFNRVFGPQFLLYDGGDRAFILTGVAPVATAIADPARLLGADIGTALPGPDAPELRRLWAEIEMWLHGSALNTERERTGKRRVSALWIWGRGANETGSRGLNEPSVEIHGGDPLIEGLIRRWQQHSRGLPTSLDQFVGTRPHVIVEFAPLTGEPQEALTALDDSWFRAAQQLLERGALSALEIIANDVLFRVTPHARMRFWRRSRGWLENLAHPA